MSSATFNTRGWARSDLLPRRLARLALGLALAVASAVRTTDPEGPLRVAGRELPTLCPVRRLTGHRCPGCGMTRGFVYLLRGRVREAIRANPLSPVALAALAAVALGATGRQAPPRPSAGRDLGIEIG